MFGSYQHLVSLQQQLAQLLSEYDAALQESSSSSSQWVPCRLSLQASSCADTEQHQHEQQTDAAGQQEQQPSAVAAVSDRLGSFLAAALADAVQRFKLCSAEVSTAMLLKQQLATCCAEVELLGQAVQVGGCVDCIGTRKQVQGPSESHTSWMILQLMHEHLRGY
jgi:hypothetical protein